jgi:RNA polymerase sigma-70 factor (ECF subfamily)
MKIDGHLERLMRQAQAGDRAAYRELLEEITPRVRWAIRRQRGFLQPADVEDLVQDVLLSLHTVRATYDASRPFMPWLFAIVANRLADAARRHARRSAREVSIDEDAVTFAAAAANTERGTYGDPELLRRALASLPAGQRRAIQLLKLDELSLKEAATVSDTSVGALKVATHRAMIALRRALLG